MRRQTKRKRGEENSWLYILGNFLVDVLLWIPQLILLPFRLAFFGIRAMFRYLSDF